MLFVLNKAIFLIQGDVYL